MPRRQKKKRRSRKRRTGTMLPYRYQEAAHGVIHAGFTNAIMVPQHLPKGRAFRPIALYLQLCARNSTVTQALQVRALSQGERTIATFGPWLVGSTPRTFRCSYPAREPNWPDDTGVSANVWAIDNLCLAKADNSLTVFCYSTIWAFGREQEQEACPTKIVGANGDEYIPSMFVRSSAASELTSMPSFSANFVVLEADESPIPRTIQGGVCRDNDGKGFWTGEARLNDTSLSASNGAYQTG